MIAKKQTWLLTALGLMVLALPASSQSPPTPPALGGSPQSTDSILWSWTAATGATGYELHDGGHQLIASLGAVTSYLESGLQENTLYQRHLHAINASGMSADGTESQKFTMIRTPLVTDFTLQAVTPTRVDIVVGLPTNPGAGAAIVYRSTDQSSWVNIGNTSTDYRLSDVGVTGSTTYYYKIKYSNTHSFSADSPVQSITTAPSSSITLPAPASFNGTGQSTTSIQWTWGAVTGAVSYDVHDENHALLANVAATSWTETNLAENNAYRRHVHAKNLVVGLRSADVVKYTLAWYASERRRLHEKGRSESLKQSTPKRKRRS